MVRAQISFAEAEYELIRKEALTLGISLAEFVRRAVRDKLPVPGDAPWDAVWGFGRIRRLAIEPIHR
jgi:hypothetical protein